MPESWADPAATDQVSIPVAVFPGDGSFPDEAVIFFDGGPGAYTLEVLPSTFDAIVEPFLGGRDVIVFDQRGVGFSEPSLACPELVEFERQQLLGDTDSTAPPANLQTTASMCSDRLIAEGVDLAEYNSIASANDVEAIRVLLGYEQLNVIGTSYGSRLAQTFMRLHPSSLRSVVLDSVFPTSTDLWTGQFQGIERAFDQLFDGCDASVACSSRYPNLRTSLVELLADLDEQPARVEVQDFIKGTAPVEALLDGDDLIGLLVDALYAQPSFSLIPSMVEEALNGNYQTLELLAAIRLTSLPLFSHGVHLSVECNEELPFETDPTGEPLNGDPIHDHLVRTWSPFSLAGACPTWPSGEAPTVESEQVISDVPTLLLGGQYDPVTPPTLMREAAAGLTMSYAFVFPHEGHALIATDCGAELIRVFIDDPETEPDSTCIANSPEPSWP